MSPERPEYIISYLIQRGTDSRSTDSSAESIRSTSGAIRDADTFAQQDFACFARGVSHKGPYKDGPGEINVPISVGGQVVHAGDVVVGDADGVVFIEAARAADVLQWALKKEAAEVDTKRMILAGEGGAKPWVDTTIAQKTEAL